MDIIVKINVELVKNLHSTPNVKHEWHICFSADMKITLNVQRSQAYVWKNVKQSVITRNAKNNVKNNVFHVKSNAKLNALTQNVLKPAVNLVIENPAT